MALTVAHRAKAYALLDGTAGADASHTMTAGRFHRTRDPIESIEANIVERAAQVVIEPPTPIAGYNNPLDGRDLSTYPLGVRVGYLITSEGDDDIDANGESSGGGSVEAIEDRANADLKAIRDVLGWQPNWPSLDPVVIDCAPEGTPTRQILADRVIYEQRFALLTRASLPGSYGPSTS